VLNRLVQNLQLKPDLALLDIHLPNRNGIESARKILIQRPQTKILIVSMMSTEEMIRQAKQMGFHGFVSKSDLARDLVPAIKAVLRNPTFFPSDGSHILSGDSSIPAA
jgi:DNA-binding NarL/FixJ family response regulator